MNSAKALGIVVKADAKQGTLTIVLPLKKDPPLSKSGKTLIVAGTAGAVETDIMINGKAAIINVNAYIYAQDKPQKLQTGGAAGEGAQDGE